MRADAGVQIVGFHLAPVSTALTLFSWAPLLVIGEAALDHADLGAGHGGVVHGDAVGAADAPALSVERLSQLRGAAAVRGG